MPKFAKDLAAADPDTYALVDMHRTRNWADVDEELNRVANLVLAADLGPNRRLAIFAENASETALAHLGGLLGGGSTVPVNFHLTADEAAYILQDSESRLLFVDEATLDRGLSAAATAGIDMIVGWRVDHPDVMDWEDWLATGDPADPPTDTVPLPNLLYTSGTTGLPKGVELPPTMFAGGGNMDEHLEALGQDRRAQFNSHLVVGPMYHTGPLSGTRLLCAGLRSVILGRFDAEATLAAIEQYGCATSVMVPTHFVRLLALPDEVKAKYDVSAMKAVGHTGAKCPVDVKEAMINWWGPVFSDSYGSTEVGVLCRIGSEEWMEHKGSVGRAVSPPFTALILDDNMNELPANTEGNLFFRDATGRGIIYPNDPEKTAASNPEPGLFTIGEIGYLDEDGYVFLTDRASDMIVSGGVNIYPAEAEQLLIEHPDVADIGCIGIPHPEMGEELKALVIPTDPANLPDPGELSTWLRERLSSYKCPRSYELVTDVHRNTMGKINKRKLRDAWLAGEIPTA